MSDTSAVGGAAAFRSEFDRSFASRPEPAASAAERLLTVTIGGDPYAFRLSDVLGLLADRIIVPLPTPAPWFLGVIGYRGLVIPVADVAAMLGYRPAAQPRWIALAGTADLPVGLAFEQFVAQVRLEDGEVLPGVVQASGLLPGPQGRPEARTTPVTGAFRDRDVVRSILSIASLLETLPRAGTPSRKE